MADNSHSQPPYQHTRRFRVVHSVKVTHNSCSGNPSSLSNILDKASANALGMGHTCPHRARHVRRPCVGRHTAKRIAALFLTCKPTHVRTDTKPSWPHRARTVTDN
ncbi:hypothetical protein J6590_088551 [Homalodisca vitripennis]|nr:hypothetical protein J6590_088551 [Homalodisca vitripennis]